MDDQVKVTTQREGSRLRVRLIFPIATEPLRRLAASGQTRPPRFVQTVVVERDGATVFRGHFGPFMARFPEVEFEVETGLVGSAERVFRLIWSDNLGTTRQQLLTLS